MKKRMSWIGVLSVLTMMGCIDVEQAKSEPENQGWKPQIDELAVAPSSKTATTPGVTALLDCGAEQQWVADDYRYWMDAHHFAFSPNDGLLLRSDRMSGMGAMFGTDDGESMTPSVLRASGMDTTWDRAVRFDQYGELQVVSAVTGEVLRSVERPNDSGEWQQAAIRGDGQAVAALVCADETLNLYYYSGDLQLSDTIRVADGCIRYGNHSDLLFTADGTKVVIGAAAAGSLHVYDVQTGTLEGRVIHAPTPADSEWRADASLLATALIPGTDQVVTTGADGRLVVTQLSDFSEVESWTVAVKNVNEMTYAPHMQVSPIAVSPGGDAIAFINLDGDIEVKGADSALVLDVPDVVTEWNPEQRFPAALLAFSSDARQLAVGTEYGAAMFGCPDTKRERLEDTLAVVLEGPATGQAHSPTAFTATHIGPVNFHAHRFMVNGEFFGHATGDRSFDWYPTEPGEYTIAVEIDDGAATGIAYHQIQISEAAE